MCWLCHTITFGHWDGVAPSDPWSDLALPGIRVVQLRFQRVSFSLPRQPVASSCRQLLPSSSCWLCGAGWVAQCQILVPEDRQTGCPWGTWGSQPLGFTGDICCAMGAALPRGFNGLHTHLWIEEAGSVAGWKRQCRILRAGSPSSAGDNKVPIDSGCSWAQAHCCQGVKWQPLGLPLPEVAGSQGEALRATKSKGADTSWWFWPQMQKGSSPEIVI